MEDTATGKPTDWASIVDYLRTDYPLECDRCRHLKVTNFFDGPDEGPKEYVCGAENKLICIAQSPPSSCDPFRCTNYVGHTEAENDLLRKVLIDLLDTIEDTRGNPAIQRARDALKATPTDLDRLGTFVVDGDRYKPVYAVVACYGVDESGLMTKGAVYCDECQLRGECPEYAERGLIEEDG